MLGFLSLIVVAVLVIGLLAWFAYYSLHKPKDRL